jgi:hypothetical protein
MPKRIQRKRAKGWRMPGNAVYVGRPTKWGNPFTGPDAVEKYRYAVSQWPIPRRVWVEWAFAGGSVGVLGLLAMRNEYGLSKLHGKHLVCWCPLDKPCHADVLLEIVNKGAKE